MAFQHVVIEDTPAPILDLLLKAADSVLARAKAHTLQSYDAGMAPHHVPAIDPVDERQCA